MQSHLHRIEGSPSINIAGSPIRSITRTAHASLPDFLYMLCKYAFLQPRLEAFQRLMPTVELFMQFIVDRGAAAHAHQ